MRESETLSEIPHFQQTNIIESVQMIDTFYISEMINSLDEYVNLLHTLRAASSDDHIHIYISSPGGSLNVGMSIINAMLSTQANVTTTLDGEACSMGSLIFLSGHNILVQRYSRLMLHNYSSTMNGKGHELESMMQSTKEMFEELATDVCDKFLTKKELKQMFDGKDFWFGPDEIIKRLNK
jgi:ATP-dependent protease ClpP protease subunit